MNILFLTIVKFDSVEKGGIYTDLVRKFIKEGHEVYVVAPKERRVGGKTSIDKRGHLTVLKIRTLNLGKTNVIEKGIGTLLVEYQFLSGVKKYFPRIKFDLVLYSTPPITFYKAISFIKKRDKAHSYLLLKDIFPQNAVDLGMIRKNGPLHRFFRAKERKLYDISDTIGCMSERNRQYIIENNPALDPHKVEVNPNSIEPAVSDNKKDVTAVRLKYNIPTDKMVFIYGGNLGKPQGVDFLLDTIESSEKTGGVFFLIIGSGTEFNRIRNWFTARKPQNALLLAGLPKPEYDQLVAGCDVGLIFLNHKFTIPNFPSRLLPYLENKMPVLAATDTYTDIGTVIERYHAGYWVEAGDKAAMLNAINKLAGNPSDFQDMKEAAFRLLMEKYTVDVSYKLIINRIKNATALS